MILPANKNYKNIFEDRKIIKLSTNDRDGFIKSGNKMVAFFEKSAIKPLIEQLQEVYNLSVSISPSVYEQFVEKKQVTKSAKTQLINKAEKQLEIDRENFDNRKNVPEINNNKQKQLELLKLKMKMKAKALELMNL